MNTEGLGAARSLEKPKAVSDERRKTVEEVFHKYHKILMQSCRKKLRIRNFSNDIESDAEEIVSTVYENLLGNKEGGINLSENRKTIINYLHKALDFVIADYGKGIFAKKRIPLEELGSWEEVDEEKDRSNYLQDSTAMEEMRSLAVELALNRIRGRNPRMADIVNKVYFQGKTLDEIKGDYNSDRTNIHKIATRGRGILSAIVNGKIKDDSSIPLQKSMPGKEGTVTDSKNDIS